MLPPDGAAELRRIIDMADEVNWPEPEPLFEPPETERPYPLDALPHVVAEAVKEYRRYGQQPLPLIACSALASLSLSAQGLVDVARDSRLAGPISLHFIAIAVSGERKTSVDRTFNKAVREWVIERREALRPAAERANAEVAAWTAEREGLLSKIKGSSGDKKTASAADLAQFKQSLVELEANRPAELILPSMFYEDTNAAALAVDLAYGWPSASLWSDEGGLVIGSNGMSGDNLMGFLALLNRLWDGLSFERHRRTTKSAFIKGRRFTVSLMMQPLVFAQLIGAGGGASRGMGYVARTLPTWPASAIGSRLYCEAAEMPALDALHARLRELLDMPLPAEVAGMALEPPLLHLSPSAFKVWRDLHDDVEKSLSRTGEFGCIPDIGAKIAENAVRIAGNFHVVEHGPGGSIGGPTMESAAAVAVWHLNEARRIVGSGKAPQDISDAELLFEWLLARAEDKIGPRDILNRGPTPLRDRKRRDAALKVLMDKHWICESKVGAKVGFIVNPETRLRDGPR